MHGQLDAVLIFEFGRLAFTGGARMTRHRLNLVRPLKVGERRISQRMAAPRTQRAFVFLPLQNRFEVFGQPLRFAGLNYSSEKDAARDSPLSGESDDRSGASSGSDLGSNFGGVSSPRFTASAVVTSFVHWLSVSLSRSASAS